MKLILMTTAAFLIFVVPVFSELTVEDLDLSFYRHIIPTG